MAAMTTAVFPLFFVLLLPSLSAASSSPYHSAAILFQSYQKMLSTFKIFIYTPSKPFDFPNAPTSLFYTSLLRSPFLTHDPTEAHLFFVPFSPDTSTRSLSRVVRQLRNDHPYWNRTLGADHFFLSPAGIDYSSDRNVLELKKNSVQISVFPVVSGYFIPHKDVTLPPLCTSPLALLHSPPVENSTAPSFLGYLRWDGKAEAELVNELKSDADFLVEEKSEAPSFNYVRGFTESRFCLFLYRGDVSSMVEAMASGCVPVVIVPRPIQDLPLMDILRWSDVALLVLVVPHSGTARVKEVLNGLSEEEYGEMRELAVAASKHLVWNDEAQPFDAFHMVMYQLWRRRHVIRYSEWEFV